MKSYDPTRRIPEDGVAEILARAAEIDRATRETVSVDALRTAAMEAGIGPAAIDAALEEYAAGTTAVVAPEPRVEEAGPERPPGRLRSFLGRLGRRLALPLKLAGIAFLVGLAGAAGEGAVLLGWGAWLVATAWLAWTLRPERKASPFALALVLMTVGLAVGFGAAEVDEDAIAMLFGVGLPLLVAGAAFIKVRLPRRSRDGEVEASAA